MDIHDVVERIRGEFNEMPGLRLTPEQAARLWGLERAACRAILDHLVASSFLCWSAGHVVQRAS